jgi:adenine deaminase
MSESYAGKINRKLLKKRRIINAAAGREPSDLVLKNATYVNVFSNELCHADIAVAEGLIVGMGQYSGTVEEDCTGKIVLPGFLDAHIHLESSLVSPKEFVKAVLPHGTTTVITDPKVNIDAIRRQMGMVFQHSRPRRACRWTCGLCCPPVCRPRPWTSPARPWTTGPSTPSMTTPGSRDWRR